MSDIEKHIPKVTRVAKLLEKTLTDDADESALPKLIGMMVEIKRSHDNVLEWAQRFGLHDAASKRQSRKRKA
eukprot:9460525-Pyramimonas_sp.AAC.1